MYLTSVDRSLLISMMIFIRH